MNSWSTVTLRDIVVPGSAGLKRGPFGGAIKKEIFVEIGYKIYEQQHAIYSDFNIGRYFIDETKFRELESFSILPDDLLVSCSGTMGRVAIVPPTPHPGIINQALLRIRPDQEKVLPKFLKRLLESPSVQQQLFGGSSGSAIKNVQPLDTIRSVPIKVPPLEEQRRIAAILDAADSLRAKRRAALAKLDQLAQSIFIEMFGDPSGNPKRFPRRLLGELIDFVGGSQPPKQTFTYSPSEDVVRLVQIRDFKSDQFKTYIPKKLAKRQFETDDVMIARYGPPIFQILRGLSGAYNVALMKARPREGVLKDFVYYLLQEKKLHSYVVARSERTAGQTGVNLDLLENYPAFLPPMHIQQAFVERVHRVEALLGASEQSMSRFKSLFMSVQHRAFRGEL